MRLAIMICGFALLAGPVFAQEGDVFMPAPSPDVMMARTMPNTQGSTTKGAQQSDPQLDRQVSATQQKIQQEERRLQSQFAQIEQLRNAAIKKQDQKELERIQQIEKQVVADYQKRVERILVAAQAQIQATTIHVKATGQQPTLAPPAKAEPTKAQPTRSTRTQSRSTQTQRTKAQPTSNSKAQSQQQQYRKSSQSSQHRRSTGYWLFRR